MIMSWQTTLGAGTSKSVALPDGIQDEHQRLNFLGHPELTRFVAFCALRETYSNDEKVLTDALQHIVTDFRFALRDGLEVRFGGESIRLRLACICTKGDWPWLIEAGLLVRHFRRAAKRHQSDMTNAGICHFCMAGTEDVPCSDATASAKWIQTMGSAASITAWDALSPLTAGLPHHPDDPAMLYRPDLFHNWHLGIGQCFIASALVIISKMCPGTSIPKQFEELTVLWRTWCREKCLSLVDFIPGKYSKKSASCGI